MTMDKYTAQKQKEAEAKERAMQDAETLKKACRSLFTTEYGRVVAKAMMKVSGIYKLDKNMVNPYEMGAERGREYMYLFFVKGMLTADQLADIETPNKEG